MHDLNILLLTAWCFELAVSAREIWSLKMQLLLSFEISSAHLVSRQTFGDGLD